MQMRVTQEREINWYDARRDFTRYGNQPSTEREPRILKEKIKKGKTSERVEEEVCGWGVEKEEETRGGETR